MNKFLRLCKKPFLITFSIIFIVSMIILIVLHAIPNASKYSYKDSFAGQTLQIDISLNQNNEAILDMFMTGSTNTSETTTVKYRVSNGKLYTQVDNDDLNLIGTINAFEIVPDMASLQEFGIGGFDITFKNNTNIALKITSIVFMCVFGVLTLGCLVIFILDKKGFLKTLKKETETIESVTPQN